MTQLKRVLGGRTLNWKVCQGSYTMATEAEVIVRAVQLSPLLPGCLTDGDLTQCSLVSGGQLHKQ